jgi:hypothetical protein
MAFEHGVTIEFSRSGGIAAVPGLQVRGTVTFSGDHGVVESGAYRRELDSDECEHLSAAAAAVVQQGESIAPPGDRSRDAYQFQLTVRAADRTVTIAAAAGSATLPPPVATLVDFLDRECAAIVRSRR